MTESEAKRKARFPAAVPGLLATPQPGLEWCLSFLFLIFDHSPNPASFFVHIGSS